MKIFVPPPLQNWVNADSYACALEPSSHKSTLFFFILILFFLQATNIKKKHTRNFFTTHFTVLNTNSIYKLTPPPFQSIKSEYKSLGVWTGTFFTHSHHFYTCSVSTGDKYEPIYDTNYLHSIQITVYKCNIVTFHCHRWPARPGSSVSGVQVSGV